jgi:hypothetical protein
MANAYIHLDSIDTLEQYRHKLEDWKRRLYALNDEMRNFHNSLENDQKWYGQSHSDFFENCIEPIYNKYFQPSAEALDEGQTFLRTLQSKAEELGIK